MKPLTIVIFRKWKDTGTILALFPEITADVRGYYCISYEITGQHGSADYNSCVAYTYPAIESEYAALSTELHRIGYQLKVIKRATRKHHDARGE